MEALKFTLASLAIFISSVLFAQPSNDNCANAIPISVGVECITDDYTSIASTSEDVSVAADPTCGYFQGGDVWFTFTVPASGDFRVDLSGNQWELYSGTCSDFTQIRCDANGHTFREPSLAGETLYLRAFRYNNDQGANFTLCIWEPEVQPNDYCVDAIAISVGQECTTQNFSSLYTTSEDVTVAQDPTCGFYRGGDVWFTFIVPASGDFRVYLSGSQWELYSGTCSNFTQIRCDNDGHNFREPSLAGETLYLRAFRYNNDQGANFTLCIWEPEVQPNDYCVDAIAISVGQECTTQNFSSLYTTSEDVTVAQDPTCGFYRGGDVWFTFTVPASGDFRVDLSGNTWEVYSGTCGSFTQLRCDDNGHNFREPSLAGQTLYLRAFQWNNDQGGDFTLCIWEPEMPLNDYCADAINIEVGQTCSTEDFTSLYSTKESTDVAENAACGFYKGGDVWFTFTAPASGDFRIELTGNQWELYSGTCGDFTQIKCDAGSVNFSDPALGGQDFYLRAFQWNTDQGGDFTLCIWETDVPENNLCANPTNIILNDSCATQSFSTRYTTSEDASIAANPSCGFFKGGDVWFTFTAPESGQFALNRTSNTNGGTTQFAFYTGNCGAFEEFHCSGDSEISFNDPNLGGEAITVRAFSWNNRQGADFDICIKNTTIAPNDMCTDATPLAVGESCTFETFNNFNSTSEEGIAPDPSCGFYQGGDVWFTIEVPSNGQFQINRGNISGGSFNYALYTGTCGDFELYDCSSDPVQSLYDAVELSNQTVYLRVFRWNSSYGGEFELCIVAGDCSGEIGGTSYIDECGNCVGGNTGLEPCVQDCNGVYGGTAVIDNCDTCVGGNTGEVACEADCNGDFGGTAYLDNCETCVGGETELLACVEDCNGDFGGTAFFDDCETCVEGNTGLEACVADCNGDFGGTAYLDNCEICVEGNTGIEACSADCNGDFGGTAYLDNCETCVGGDTGLNACVADCNGDFGGTAYLDNCEICVGGNTGTAPCVEDCNGDFGGSAFIDDCDTCVGGETGVEPCSFDCLELEANIGDSCDDGDEATENDMITEDCGCEGTIIYDCPALSANIGDSCDDGDEATENDMITEDCGCVGTIIYDCPALSANIGDSCDDGDEATENDMITEDCGCVGTIVYDCPELEANIGDACDDGNEATENDMITEDCGCVGTIIYDCPALSANIGDSCDDGDEATENDMITEDCGCVGVSVSLESTALLCSDGIDNDGNGLIDCEDPGCQSIANNIGCLTCFEDGSSFADAVIDYENNCSNTTAAATNPAAALGAPDYSGNTAQHVSLGRGFIKLAFTNNTLTNSGTSDPDLFVFEVGPQVESSLIELRPLNSEIELLLIAEGILDTDADGFYEFGGIGGSLASIDIDSFFDGIPANSLFFNAIKIVDAPGGCSTSTPGADIDGVCALSSVPCNVGESCDDGNPETYNDVITPDCGCEGTYDCPALEANIGDACDDGNAATANDMITADCGCEGTYDCPALEANIGDACNDGNEATENDMITEDCGCEGTIVYDCPELEANIGDACNDGNEATANDIITQDCGCEGTIVYDCPELEANIGDACNDGNEATENDIITEDCGCEGTIVYDCPELEANIGDACDDGSEATENDMITEDCGCEGTIVYDCPALEANIGDACDDGSETTENDMITEDCGCEGTIVYDCPELEANIGESCNDGNEATENDIITEDCGCEGTIVYDCPVLEANIGDACDDGSETTENDMITEDCGCEGTIVYDCPELEANIGDACDDGSEATENDMITEDCGCEGTIVYDCPELEANIGDACDDGNENTVGDAINEDCECEGSLTYDCPELEANIGDACDDGSEATENDMITEDCGCEGTIVYDCPELEANIGDACDDGNASTENDMITEDCGCEGTIVYDCPELGANIGDACNDGNENTVGDAITEDCECEGSLTYDCPELEANIGDACDDGSEATENDMITEDCGCEGTIVYDCPALEANIGDACDDGNPSTENDIITEDCGCEGTIVYDCPELEANIGDACNDGNEATENDIITEDCGCEGTIVYDCPELEANIGDACNDGNEATENDIITEDCGCEGTIVYDCPELEANIGDACNDGNASTENDIITEDCGCEGTIVYDCPELEANIGDACNDGNEATENDIITEDCGCEGTIVYDCPELEANIGESCNDGNEATENDMITEDCGCEGTIVYDCPELEANIGESCNDGNEATENDMITEDCGCEGTIVYDCPELEANIGDACDDGNPLTTIDMIDLNCECLGIILYDCPELEANIGDICDDGNPATEFDIVTDACACEGTPINVFDCPDLEANFGDACNDGNELTENDMINAECACEGTLIDPSVCQNFVYYLADYTPATGTSIYQVNLNAGIAEMTFLTQITDEVHLAYHNEYNLLYAVSKLSNSYYTLNPHADTPVFTGPTSIQGAFGQVTGAAFSHDGKLVISSQSTNEIYSVNVVNNTVSVYDTYSPITGGDIAFSEVGMLYLATNAGGGGLYEAYSEGASSDVLIGSIPSNSTGLAITEFGDLLLSARNNSSLDIYTAGGNPYGGYDLMLDGESFALNYGDMASGCNTYVDPNESDCENFNTFYAQYNSTQNETTIYGVNFSGSDANLSLLTTVSDEMHIAYRANQNTLYLVSKSGSYMREYYVLGNGISPSLQFDINLKSITGVDFNQNDGLLYIADDKTDMIYTVDPELGSFVSNYMSAPVHGGDISIFTDGTIYLATQSGNALYDVSNGITPVFVGGIPSKVTGAATASGGSSLIISNYQSNAFVEINASDASNLNAYTAKLDGEAFTLLYGDMASGCIDIPIMTMGTESNNSTHSNLATERTTLSSHPNPTSGASQVVFVPANTTRILVEVYDMSGRKVTTLFDENAQKGLEYRLNFNGHALPNGVYIYKLTNEKESIIEKFMIAQ